MGAPDNCILGTATPTGPPPESCMDGYYLDSAGACLKCRGDCETCESETKCLTCYAVTAVINASGVCVCPVNQYLDTFNKVCGSCSKECQECAGPNSLTCTVCYSIAVLTKYDPSANIGSCICNDGFYLNTISRICAACEAQCLQCSGPAPTQCLSCTGGASLDIDSSCKCRLGYYWAQTAKSCKSCLASCQTCSDEKTCSTCYSTAILDGTSQCKCPNRFYLNQKKRLCMPCHVSCLTCSGPLSNQCTSCFPDVGLSQESCVCPTAEYLDIFLEACKPCVEDCLTCFGGTNASCLSCKAANTVASSSTHTCACIQGWYAIALSPLQCGSCAFECLSCQYGPSICTSCKPNSSLFNNIPGLCYCNTGFLGSPSDPTYGCYQCVGFSDTRPACPHCPDGQFDDGTKCVGCTTPCLACVNTQTTCASCVDGYYLVGTQCSLCNVTCQTCVGGSTMECLSCSGLYTQLTSSSPPAIPPSNSSPGKCLCVSGYFRDSANLCQPCDPECLTCVSSDRQSCTSCRSDSLVAFHVTDSIVQPNVGYCTCTEGYYAAIGSVYACSPCFANCLTCVKSSATDCVTCRDSNASIYTPVLNNARRLFTPGPVGQCKCNAGYYDDGGNCSACHPTCLTCVGGQSTMCVLCYSPGYIVNGTCTCATGLYYGLNGGTYTCRSCHSTCLSCSSGLASDCMDCFSNAQQDSGIRRLLFPAACVCQSGFFPDPDPGKCSSCAPQCKECSGPTASLCVTCYGPALPSSSPGACQCPAGQYYGLNSSFDCRNCSQDCKECADGTTAGCTACMLNASLTATLGECKCNDGYFPVYSSTPKLCQGCDTACKTCDGSGPSSCQSCYSNASLVGSACECDAGFAPIPSVGECSPCDSHCATCQVTNQNYCLTCKENMTLNSGSCACISEYTWNGTTCDHCSPMCLICTSATICSSCKSNTIFQALACSCSPGFYPDLAANECVYCDQTCATCQGPGPTQCTSCKAHTVLLTSTPGECMCAPGFYRDGCSGTCLPCDSSCRTCNYPGSSNCLDCYLLASLNPSPTGECVCDSGTVTGSLPSNCLLCDLTCASCSTTGIFGCSGCLANAQLTTAHQCICTPPFFGEPDARNCVICDSSCHSCNHSGPNGCTSCSPGFYLSSSLACVGCPIQCSGCVSASLCSVCKDANASGVMCLCNPGYTAVAGGLCQACDSTCLTCIAPGPTSCSMCFPNAVPTAGACVCLSIGFSGTATTCLPCHSTCSTCTGTLINQCIACHSGAQISVVFTGRCECSPGHYPNPSAAMCSLCDPACGNCIDGLDTSCTSCPANALFISTNPGPCKCSDGFYVIVPFICMNCPIECTVCGSPTSCSSCRDVHASGPLCTCASGYFASSGGLCSLCDANCQACSGAGPTACTSCFSNSVLTGTSCICPAAGFYGPPNNCFPCDSTCASCASSGPSQCTSCLANADLLSAVNPGTCVCAGGYFQNLTSANCSKCSSACGNCNDGSDTKCSSCPPNAALTAGNPSPCQCQTGFYLINPFACLVCPIQCTECSSPSVCTACRDMHASGIQCECDVGYFSIAGGLCSNCDSSCFTCSAAGAALCLSCFPNSVLVFNACTCPSAGFAGTPSICLPCDSSCATCSGPYQNECISCFANASVSGASPGPCQCVGGYFANPNSAVCALCSQSCGNCQGPGSSDCLSCPVHAHLSASVPSDCLCESGFYLTIPFLCVSCPQVCTACSSPTLCSSCLDPNASTPQCTCNPGYYAIAGGKCSLCDSSCLTCSGPGTNACISCFTHAVNTSGVCICPSIGFSGPPNACQPCSSTCVSCSGPSSSQCSICHMNASITGSGVCLCDAGYFSSPTVASCASCHPTCWTCSGPLDTACDSCPSNSQLSTSAPSSCHCVTGYTTMGSPPVCVLCSPECLTCDPGSPTTCLSCKPGASLSSSNSCLCSLGYYPNPTPASCQACPGLCASCDSLSPSLCLSCKPHSSIISPGTCQCDSGFSISDSGLSCSVCHSTCKTCANTSPSGCLSCPVASGLVSSPPSTCQCLTGFYRNPVTLMCVQSAPACGRCGVTGQCQECGSHAGIPFGASSCQCVPGYFPNPDATNCSPCHPDCAQCSNGSQHGCTVCQPHAVLSASSPSSCLCMTGFYPLPDASMCTPCLQGCESCLNGISCLSCFPQYVLDSSICVPCPEKCLTCFSPLVCGSCVQDWFLSSFGGCKQCQDCDQPLTAAATGPFGYQYNITFSRFVQKNFTREDLNLSTDPASAIDWSVVQNNNLNIAVSGGPWSNSTSILISFPTPVRDEFGNSLTTQQLVVPPPFPPIELSSLSNITTNVTIETATTATSAAVGGTLVVAGASTGGGSLAMALLSQMQYFSYISTANYTMTGDMNSFYTSLNQKSALPNFFGQSQGVQKRNIDRKLEESLNLVNAKDFLDNCGQFLSILVIIMGVHGVVYGLYRLFGKRFSFLSTLNAQFRYTVYLCFWYFSYLDLEVAALLQLVDHDFEMSTGRQVACTLLALLTIILASITPLLVLALIYFKSNLLFSASENPVKSKFSSVISSLRADLAKAKYLFPVYYFQRLLYGFLIVFMREMKLYQAAALVVPSLIMTLFVIIARPMATLTMRVLHLLAELDCLIVFILLFFVTLQYNTPRIDICWLIVGFTLKSFLCTSLIVLIGFISTVKAKCQRRKRTTEVHPICTEMTQGEERSGAKYEDKDLSFGREVGSVYFTRVQSAKVIGRLSEEGFATETERSDLTEKTL